LITRIIFCAECRSLSSSLCSLLHSPVIRAFYWTQFCDSSIHLPCSQPVLLRLKRSSQTQPHSRPSGLFE
jgi:hypothetical protein